MKIPRDKTGWWFAIPLRRGGYAAALIARNRPSSMMLVYPLDRHFSSLPSQADLDGLSHADFLHPKVMTTNRLREGKWSMLFRFPSFAREEWPLPVQFRVPPIGGPAFMVMRKESDLSEREWEKRYDPGSDPREVDFTDSLYPDSWLADFFETRFNPR
jgi:hypothetical protein